MRLVGFTIDVYHDARPYERQIQSNVMIFGCNSGCVFSDLRKISKSDCWIRQVCLSAAAWDNSVPSGQIFMKFYI